MTKSCPGWYWHFGLASSLAIGGVFATSFDCALAQITPDGTLGASGSVVTPTAAGSPVDVIQGGATRGTNLFHSFEEFSIPTGGTAYFNNAADIQNIISRVTGGAISNIDGLIRANASANLFLINPNGIIFGPNASLDIGGSFVGSTASSLNFADGTEFSATAPQTTPLLKVSVPIGLQFGENPGSILNQSVTVDSSGIPVGLQVQPGKTLALVGGDVALEGSNLTAYSGRIELGSVAGPSLVSLTPTAQGWDLGYEGVQNFRDIQLSQAAYVDTSGEGGGDIQVQGRRVSVRDGSQIAAFTAGSRPTGTLVVNASESVEVIGSGTIGDDTFFSTLRTDTLGSGAAGDLSITTGKLIVQDGAFVSAATSGSGRGGNLVVTASNSVELSGASADSQFPGGLFSQTLDSGDAGNLTITTRKLIAQDGGQVAAGTSFGSLGKGGTLTVRASDSVELSGTAPNGKYPSGLFAWNRGIGSGGNLTIATGKLIVRDGAEASVSSLGSGNAGNIKLTARSIRLDNFGKLTAESALGQGGDITLQAQDVELRRNSEISTTAGTAGVGGNGGNIDIDTNLLVAIAEENSDITANAFVGKGGFIQITAQAIFGIERREQLTPLSDITAFSQQKPEINGVVTEAITPDALPAEPVDVTGLIAQGCSPGGGNGGKGASEFIITGRGGLPPTPRESLNIDAVVADLGTPIQGGENRGLAAIPTKPITESAPNQIVEAQGWVINALGEVVLTARPSSVTPHTPWLTAANCHTPQTSS